MNDSVYFEGDPETESTRRHMERVLEGQPTRRWWWVLAALGGGGVWLLWRSGRAAQRGMHGSAEEPDRPAGS